MHEYAQDAIAYVRLYGRPDLFVAFTTSIFGRDTAAFTSRTIGGS